MGPDLTRPITASEHLDMFSRLLVSMLTNYDDDPAHTVLLDHLDLIETRVQALESIVARADQVAFQLNRDAVHNQE